MLHVRPPNSTLHHHTTTSRVLFSAHIIISHTTVNYIHQVTSRITQFASRFVIYFFLLSADLHYNKQALDYLYRVYLSSFSFSISYPWTMLLTSQVNHLCSIVIKTVCWSNRQFCAELKGRFSILVICQFSRLGINNYYRFRRSGQVSLQERSTVRNHDDFCRENAETERRGVGIAVPHHDDRRAVYKNNWKQLQIV